jgi:alkylated DNA repair dioxygenase AlkB
MQGAPPRRCALSATVRPRNVDVQGELFEHPGISLPAGMQYREEFVGHDEEAALLAAIAELPLREARYKGYTARRRVASYGTRYDFDDNRLLPADEIAPFLLPLRARLAAWAGVASDAFTNALVAEYRPGTPLGWHRDVPDYELVAGVSLAGSARMRLRPFPPVDLRRDDVLTLELAPRSAYVLQGSARWGWQHSIMPTPALRYSITFRTRRDRLGR